MAAIKDESKAFYKKTEFITSNRTDKMQNCHRSVFSWMAKRQIPWWKVNESQ